MKIKTVGYARVSTDDQRLDLQLSALKAAGCTQIFSDKGISGAEFARPGLDMAIGNLRTGDTLIVWRLDRLGRSLKRLVELVDQFGKRGIQFRSLNEAIDTSSSGGRLVFHMMAALSEFERNLISERTRAGMEAARQGGRRVGRPPSLNISQVSAAYVSIYIEGEDIDIVASRLKVSKRTLRRSLNANDAQLQRMSLEKYGVRT
ncbi:recombinase family protein [Pseudotabrizicola alkalilacus]|uniref:Recombinase family protein n=2 Tax=Pseudotabrizicola alkalilacus TaxID=2305252 RepID=A0A411YXC5_9RHOB|nr:recombinase family protein [Pseudotabrizicola alkalilacus]